MKKLIFIFVFKLRYPGQADVPIVRILNVRAGTSHQHFDFWVQISHVYTSARCAEQHLQ